MSIRIFSRSEHQQATTTTCFTQRAKAICQQARLRGQQRAQACKHEGLIPISWAGVEANDP
eukprot:4840479-Prorocentrum_lima.AAC.1